MGRSCSFLLLLFLLCPWPRATVALLQYRHDCGELGMQLLVFPYHGHTIRFKVLDEFGSRFDVANCSICLHWLNSREDGSIIFSSGYKGCHVLFKENRYILRVQLEELRASGIPVNSYEVNMTCPKPGGSGMLPGGTREQARDSGLLVSHTGLHQLSESSLTLTGSQFTSRDHLEQVHTVGRYQPSPVLSGIQHHSSPAHSGLLSQPGGVHPVTQIQGTFMRPGGQSPHPGGQTQPGILRPVLVSQNHPSPVHPGGQTQPGHLHSGFVSQHQPGMAHPGGQNQPGIRPGSVSQNQPGVVHPGGQIQPGIRPGSVSHNHPGALRPGLVSHNQPGLTSTGAQTPAGFLRPVAQPPNQPGISRPGHHSSSGLQGHTGLLHPGHPSPALVHPGLSSWPGFISPGLQAQPQPGLGRPGLQPQPGLLHPGINSQPSLLESTALFYPSAGAGKPQGAFPTHIPCCVPLCFPPGAPLTREQCQVPVGRLACVAPQGRDGCLQAGCCYDDMDRTTPCYYGNTATVQCLLEGYFVLVVPRGMVTQPYNLDSVRLASSQEGCEPLHTSEAFVMFRFPVTHCGTTVQVVEDKLIYENQLISTIDVQGSPRGSVTRDSVYILHARCIYNSSDLLPLGVEVAVPPTAAPLAMPGPLGLQLRIATGECSLSGSPSRSPSHSTAPNIPTDESYSSYHPVGDFPLVRVLRDPIYVEVRLLQKTDPNLVLVLHHCWASPGSHATSQPQWPILVEGCPFQGDNYRTRLIPMGPASPELPFPSHYQRFVISTFAFVEPSGTAVLEGEVYISCSASVCHLAQPEPCRPSCQLGVPSRARRSLGDRRTGDSMGTATSQGCIVFPEVLTRGGT
ncbi:ZP1 protein, partial [Brachypodius atriceps]|nr:ZP1 protein [Brachypodius atriceps]